MGARERAEFGTVSEGELGAFREWLQGPPRNLQPRPASDYRSRFKRALRDELSTMIPTVRAGAETAMSAFRQFRNHRHRAG